jgi:hypothetical protein
MFEQDLCLSFGEDSFLPPTTEPLDSRKKPRIGWYPVQNMDYYRVSKLANNTRNDSPVCIRAA